MKLCNLNFHQTFPPDVNMISRLLTSDVFEVALTKEEISQRTGIPTGKSSGKVEPHIKYAEYMGLLQDSFKDGKHTLIMTPLGRAICSEDPSLTEKVSILTCYLRITSLNGGAPLWETIIAEILPRNRFQITEPALRDTLLKETDVAINFGPFFSSFDDAFFSSLQILDRSKDAIRIIKQRYDSEMIFSYTYAFFREWEFRYPDRDELTADEIEKFLLPGVLGWQSQDFYSIMEYMQEKKLLVFNRQLVPYTITRFFNSEAIIPRLYDELC